MSDKIAHNHKHSFAVDAACEGCGVMISKLVEDLKYSAEFWKRTAERYLVKEETITNLRRRLHEATAMLAKAEFLSRYQHQDCWRLNDSKFECKTGSHYDERHTWDDETWAKNTPEPS